MTPLSWVKARFRGWWLARLRPNNDHYLTQRNVYILPTAPGLLLAITLVVLLLASINFQLNLGYALTFLLAGCSLVGMHMGHATLRGLHLQLLPPAAQFLGAPATLPIQLHNHSSQARYGVGLALQNSGAWSWVEVPPQGSCALSLTWLAPQRGLAQLPLLSAESRFPMGAFRVWTVWQPAASVWVYPCPEVSAPPLPVAQVPERQGTTAGVAQLGGDWDGVRAYRRGDDRKQIVWKKAAQAMATGSASLVSRDTSAQTGSELWLDYTTTGLTDKEARLSRLCAWICEAERQGLYYGLRLPRLNLAPASGAAHQRSCLEALALC